MGRKPKPTAVKIFEGNPSKRPLNRAEPVGPEADLSCPEWLGPRGAAKWRELAPMLSAMRVLTQADRDVLSAYCEAWEEFFEAREIMAREGLVAIGDKGGEYIHPAVNIKNSALKRIKEFGGLLGLSPVARVGLKLPEATAGGEFERESELYA